MKPFTFLAINVTRRKQLSGTPFLPFPCLFQLQPVVLFVGLQGEEGREEGNCKRAFPGFSSWCLGWLWVTCCTGGFTIGSFGHPKSNQRPTRVSSPFAGVWWRQQGARAEEGRVVQQLSGLTQPEQDEEMSSTDSPISERFPGRGVLSSVFLCNFPWKLSRLQFISQNTLLRKGGHAKISGMEKKKVQNPSSASR